MNCIACGYQSLEEVWHNLHKCKKCGTLQRVNPEEYYENIKHLYNETYFSERYKRRYGKELSNDIPNIKSIANRRIEVIENLYLRESECYGCESGNCNGCYVRNLVKSLKDRKLLDIGCGNGIFLDVAKSRGFDVKGIDFNKNVLHLLPESVRNSVIIRDFLNFTTNEKFDIITMFFVIEHLPNIEDILKKVWNMLKYGGILGISTPNGNGFTATIKPKGYYSIVPEDHLYEFSPKGMIILLERNNYKIRRIINTGFHPERVTNSKLVMPFIRFYQRLLGIGDTFEIYAVKRFEGNKTVLR